MAKLNFKDLIFKFLQKDEDHDCEKVHPKMKHKEWMNTEPVKTVKENIEVYITKKGSGPVNKRSIVKDFNNKAEAEKWIKWYKTGNMKDVESIYLSIQEDVESIKLNEDTDYLKSKLNTHQINNIKNTWKSKKASDVTPAVKALIKKMDIPTQLAIKQADIPHLSKLIEVNEDTNIYIGNDKKEDTDIDSVNDVALKNAEKSKSKDKDTKESKALTKEEQDHIKKEFGIKYEALSPEKQKQMDQLMKDFLARGGKIKKLKPGIAKGAGHLDKRGPYKADMLKGSKKHLAAQKDNSDELAGGKTATGQKVSKVDTRPNIREV